MIEDDVTQLKVCLAKLTSEVKTLRRWLLVCGVALLVLFFTGERVIQGVLSFIALVCLFSALYSISDYLWRGIDRVRFGRARRE